MEKYRDNNNNVGITINILGLVPLALRMFGDLPSPSASEATIGHQWWSLVTLDDHWYQWRPMLVADGRSPNARIGVDVKHVWIITILQYRICFINGPISYQTCIDQARQKIKK